MKLVKFSAVQYSTILYSAVQCITVLYSIVQYITVQYSLVQYSLLTYQKLEILLLLEIEDLGCLTKGDECQGPLGEVRQLMSGYKVVYDVGTVTLHLHEVELGALIESILQGHSDWNSSNSTVL